LKASLEDCNFRLQEHTERANEVLDQRLTLFEQINEQVTQEVMQKLSLFENELSQTSTSLENKISKVD
jgi:hypothetical protein